MLPIASRNSVGLPHTALYRQPSREAAGIYTTTSALPRPCTYTSGLTACRCPCGVFITFGSGVTAEARRATLNLIIALAATSCLSTCGQAEEGEDDGVGLHLWLEGSTGFFWVVSMDEVLLCACLG